MEKRDTFKSRWGFIMACIGSAVGMGNIWLFPLRLGKGGGGAFLIAYIIWVIILGYSGVVEEITLGRMTRNGPIGAFSQALQSRGKNPTIGKVLGMIPVIGSLCIAIGYSVVMGWIFHYTFNSFTGAAYHVPDTGEYFGKIAGAFGVVPWHLLALVVTFLVMTAGVSAGIERLNKFMMPAFFLLFIILAVRISFIPGAEEGYRYMFYPDWSLLAQPMTWVFAMGQAFFSLSLAGNGTLIYGSYFKSDEDILYSARLICIFDSIAAMLAAMVIIPACTALLGFDKLSAGPPLMFITMPMIFQELAFGQIFMIIFFVAVLFAGLTSLVNLFEAPIATMQEMFNLSRAKATITIAVVGTAIAVCIEGIVGEWMDILSIYVIPVGALLAAVMLYWVFGIDKASSEMQKGHKHTLNPLVPWIGKYVFCPLALVVIILGIVFKGIG